MSGLFFGLLYVIGGLFALLVIGVVVRSIWQEWEYDAAGGCLHTIILLVFIALLIGLIAFIRSIGSGLFFGLLFAITGLVAGYVIYDRFYVSHIWRFPLWYIVSSFFEDDVQESRVTPSKEKPKRKNTEGLQQTIKMGIDADGLITVRGVGRQVSDSVELTRGRYRIQYKSYTDKAFSVDLINVDELEEEPENIVYFEDDSGSTMFNVSIDGRYAFEIAGFSNEIKWAFRVKKLS
jgi:hypothetical protein